MKRNNRLIALIVLAIFQISLPLYFIADREKIHTQGKEYLFRIRPVDPYDFFQGKYLSLNVSALNYEYSEKDRFKANDMVYVSFEQDSLGAKVTEVSAVAKEHSLKIRLPYAVEGKRGGLIYLPFKRFYTEEFKAKRLERQVNSNCFVHVKILNGEYVITDLSSKGKSIITGNSVASQ